MICVPRNRENLGAFMSLLGMILLANPLAVMFFSFLFGMMGNAILRRMSIYERFSDRYLFSGSEPYESLGVLWYRKILLATPLRFFNPNIRFSANRSLATLNSVMMHIKTAEVVHWVGFAAMLVLNFAVWWYVGIEMALAYLSLNVFGNLYPCLLQQYNRRRLTRVITAIKVRSESLRNDS
jgi:Glycosyl-4,4'-diaponeurosporenoate acyltransferase